MSLDLGELVGSISLDTGKLDSALGKSESGLSGWQKAAVAAGAAAAVGMGKALYDIGGTFDDLGDTIRVGTGATGKDLEGLTDSAKKIGTEIPASFEDIGTTVSEVNTRLGLTGPTLEKLSEQFLEAGRLTGQAIDIKSFTAAFNAFDVKGKDTTRVMDDIFRVSQATGVGMNDLAKSVAANAPQFTQFGFSITDSVALLGNLDKAGLNGNRTVAALSRAMVEFADEGKKPRAALEDTISKIEGFTKAGQDAKAINLAADIFGTRGASQFVAAVKSGTLNLNDLMGATGATSDTILKASADTQDFSEKWQIFKNKVLVQLEPVATRVFGAINTALIGMMNAAGPTVRFLEDHKVAVIALTGVVAALVVVTQAHAAAMAVAAAGGMAQWLMQTNLISAATKVWTAVQWAMNAALAANPIMLIVIGLAALVAALVLAYQKSETFRNIVNGAFGAVKDFAVAALDWIIEKAKAWGPYLLGALLGPLGLLVVAVVKHWDDVKEKTRAVWDWVVDKVKAIPGLLVSFFLNWTLPGIIASHWRDIKDKTVQIATAIVTWVAGLPGRLVEALASLRDRLVTTFGNAMSAAKDKVVGIGETVLDWIRGIPDKILNLTGRMSSAGRSIIQAFVDGMKNAAGIISGIAGNVWDAVRGMLNSAIDKINAALSFTISLPGPDITVNPPDIPHLASGGRATGSQLAVIGDGAEPESVLPDSMLRGLLERAHDAGSADIAAKLDELIAKVEDLPRTYRGLVRQG